MLGPNALETTSMDDYFQFIVHQTMNSWMINMNLPFLLGDRQAVRSGPIIFPLISNNWVGNLAFKDWYFSSKGGGGGGEISIKVAIINFKAYNA